LSSVTKTISNALGAETSRRRFVTQLGLSSAVLFLTACGGGGGSGLVEDDSSDDDTARLRRAFDELQTGMTTQDVINVVGRSPNNRGGSLFTWNASGGSLEVGFAERGADQLGPIGAAFWISSSGTLSRYFEVGS